MPPKEGLQEHTPRFEMEGVMRAVLAPDRAAAAAASHPAWPPPTTTTSKNLKRVRVEQLEWYWHVGEGYRRCVSETVAKVLRARLRDRTRGAWPQSWRALWGTKRCIVLVPELVEAEARWVEKSSVGDAEVPQFAATRSRGCWRADNLNARNKVCILGHTGIAA